MLLGRDAHPWGLPLCATCSWAWNDTKRFWGVCGCSFRGVETLKENSELAYVRSVILIMLRIIKIIQGLVTWQIIKE